MRGKFITFEGPEGAGKTSACKMVTEIFPNRRITITREPGSTSFGEKIRSILQTENMPARSELMLFEAARACIVDTVIIPLLEEGVDILCDRFYDSTTSYQGFGRGLPLEQVSYLNQMATNGLTPDLTVVFDIDPLVGMQRKGAPSDRIEAAGPDFHRRVRDGFLQIVKCESGRMVVIDASRPQKEVASMVGDIIKSRFGW